MEISVLVSERNDSHFKAVGLRVADSEAYTIDSNAALFDSDITLASHLLVDLITESVTPTAVGFNDISATGSLVNVALDNVAVEPSVHNHAALHIHLIADFQFAEIAALESFLHSSDSVRAIAWELDNSETNAIVRNTLVDFQLVSEAAPQSNVQITAIVLQGHNSSRFLNNSRKHSQFNYYTDANLVKNPTLRKKYIPFIVKVG
jgi:hypothetical protein